MQMALGGIQEGFNNSLDSGGIYSETNTLQYAQAGMRFTATVGSSDLGFQYYFGRLPRPVISGFDPDAFFVYPYTTLNSEALIPIIDYNHYHHIGVDFARVVAGFNLRAEAGANITGDSDGTDGTIENPALVWSLGFDRDVFAGINLNLQGTGRVRLFHDKIGKNRFDCEAGSDVSSTRITGIISRKFLRDELELKTTALWGIEEKDFLIMPAIVWSRSDVKTELAAGFFGGDKKGELGQYRDNGFVRISLSYSF
jgi:hypothetical protein